MAAERESLESCPTAAQFAQVVHEIVVCDGEPNNAIRRPRKRRRKVAPPQIGNLESPASLVENESDHVGNTEGGHENVKRSEPQGYYSSDFYESDDAD